jgi:protein-disulfide isomerase
MAKGNKDAKREAQERLAAERAAQKAADRKRSILLGSVTVVVIALIAGGVALAYVNQSNAAKDVGTLPANVSSENYGVITGTKTTGVPVIDVYEDFQCPACAQFEAAAGPTLKELADDGLATVVYHPMQFLDQNLNNDSSARAANASGCAADQDKFLAFHNQVYANQPEREGTGFTDEDLLGFGAAVGLTNEQFTTCVADQSFAKWALNGVQREAENRGVNSTPTVFVDGRELERTAENNEYTPEGLKAAVEKASNGS